MSDFPLTDLTDKFSKRPGAHERHLLRRYKNPLFRHLFDEVTIAEQEDAVLQDRLETEKFIEEFRGLVEEVVSLDEKAESEVILDLKQRLDRSFEVCAGLAGDMSEVQASIRQLVGLMMTAIRVGAGNDATAQQNLDEEDMAREMHFKLLEMPLMADVLRPDSQVTGDALAPTLLSEDETAVSVIMSLFTEEQQDAICEDAKTLLEKLETDGIIIDKLWDNLKNMQSVTGSAPAPTGCSAG